MIRSFIALPLLPPSRSFLKNLQTRLPANIKPSPPNNFHLTLVFLGPTPLSKITPIKQIIAHHQTPKPLSLSVTAVSAFPRANRAKLFYASISGRDIKRLLRLVSGLKRSLKSQKISFDPQPFKPHITLARRSSAIPFSRQIIKPSCLLSFGPITLFSSLTTPAGPIYQSL